MTIQSCRMIQSCRHSHEYSSLFSQSCNGFTRTSWNCLYLYKRKYNETLWKSSNILLPKEAIQCRVYGGEGFSFRWSPSVMSASAVQLFLSGLAEKQHFTAILALSGTGVLGHMLSLMSYGANLSLLHSSKSLCVLHMDELFVLFYTNIYSHVDCSYYSQDFALCKFMRSRR
jgi:hypothetical protein